MQGIKLQFDKNSVSNIKQEFNKLMKDMESKSTISINFDKKAFQEANNQILNIEKRLRQIKSKSQKIASDSTKDLFSEPKFGKMYKDVESKIDNISKKIVGNGGEIQDILVKTNAKTGEITSATMKYSDSLGKVKTDLYKIKKEYEEIGGQKQLKNIDLEKSTQNYKNNVAQQQNHYYKMVRDEIKKANSLEIKKAKLGSDDVLLSKELDKQINKHDETINRILNNKIQINEQNEAEIINRKQLNNLIKEMEEHKNKVDRFKVAQIDNAIRKTSTTSSGKRSLGTPVKLKIPFNFNADKKELDSYAKSVGGLKAEWTKLTPKVDSAGNKIKEVSVRTKEGSKYWHNYSMVLDETTGKVYKVDKGLSDLKNRQLGLIEKAKIAGQSLLLWAGATDLVYGSIHKIKEGIGFMNEMNKMQTNIQMITDMSRPKVQGLTKDFSDLAGALHSTTKETTAGAENFLRAGKSIDETKTLLKASTIGGKISGQETSNVSEQLIAISNGFKVNLSDAKEVMGIIDKLSTVDNNASTSFKELATAMQYTSSTAQSVGVTMPQLISYIGTVSSVSRKSAESIGNSIRTIFTRYSSIKEGKKFDPENQPLSNVEKSLNRVGIALRKDKTHFKEFNEVYEEIGRKWNKLNDIEKSTISASIAGTRQKENFEILVSHMNKVQQLQDKMQESAGSAEKKFDKNYASSTEAKINDLKHSVEELYMTFMNSDSINHFIGGLTKITQALSFVGKECKGSAMSIMGLSIALITLIKHADGLPAKFSGFNINLAGIRSLLSGGLSSALELVKKGVTALISPMGIMVATLGTIIFLLGKNIAKKKKLKEEMDLLKGSYKGLTQAMKENNVELMKEESKGVRNKEKTLQNLIKQKEKIERSLKKTPTSQVNHNASYVENNKQYAKLSSDLDKVNKKIDEQIGQLEKAGFTVNEYTGKIVELDEAQLKINNNKIVEKLEKEEQMALKHKDEISDLMQEYQKLNTQENKNSEAKERMSQISKQLGSEISELVVVTDKDGNATIKNTGLIDKKVKMIDKEKDAIVTKYNIMRENAKEEAKIQVGSTQLTYAEVKKRIQAIKDEIKSLNLLIEAKRRSSFNPEANEDDSVTAGLIMKNRKFKQNQITELEDLIKQVDDLYSKPVGGGNKSGIDEYIPNADEASKSTDKLGKSADNAKTRIDAYENSIRKLDLALQQLDSRSKKLYEHSNKYVESLNSQKNIIQEKIRLTEQQIKAYEKLGTIAPTNVSAPSNPRPSSGGSYNGKYANIINEASRKYGVDSNLIVAVIQQESGFNPNVTSPAGAQGLMQLMPGTARGLGVSNAYDPYQNIMGGTKELANLSRRYNGNIDLMLAGYNAGIGNVQKYGGVPPFSETQNYLRIVKSNLANLGGSGGLYTVTGKDNVSQANDGQSNYNKVMELKSNLIKYQDELNQFNTQIVNAKLGMFDDIQKSLDKSLNQFRQKVDLSGQYNTTHNAWLRKIQEYDKTKLEKFQAERKFIEAEMKSGQYDEKTIETLRQRNSELGTKMLEMNKELKNIGYEIANARWEGIKSLYETNMEMISNEMSRLQLDEEKNIKGIAQLKQQIVEQDIANIQRITTLIKELNKEEEKYDRQYLFDKITEYNKELDKANTLLAQHKKELEDVHKKQKEIVNTVEEKVKSAILKMYDLEKEQIDKITKHKLDAIDEEIKKMDEAEKRNSYAEQKTEQLNKIKDLQSKIAKLSLDDSSEGMAKRLEYERQLKEEMNKKDDMQMKHSIEQQKESLKNMKDNIQKNADNQKRDIDTRMDNYYVNLETKQSLAQGYIMDINGKAIDIQKALMDYLDYYENGVLSVGDTIKKQILEQLNSANKLLKEAKDITSNNKGANATKNVYGSRIDLDSAKAILGIKGYNYIDTSMVDMDKINLGANDVVLGGDISRKDLNGATRIAGSNRQETAEILKLYKDVADGKIKPSNGIVYGSGIDLYNAMKWLSPLGYEFIDTDKINIDNVAFRDNDLIVGGKGAINGINFNTNAKRLGGSNRFKTDEAIREYALNNMRSNIGDKYNPQTGTVYGKDIDLALAKKYLSKYGYKFVETDNVADLNLNENDIVVGGQVKGQDRIYNNGANWLWGNNRSETESAIRDFSNYIKKNPAFNDDLLEKVDKVAIQNDRLLDYIQQLPQIPVQDLKYQMPNMNLGLDRINGMQTNNKFGDTTVVFKVDKMYGTKEEVEDFGDSIMDVLKSNGKA